MGETKIEWCKYTFNPWWGCVRVSPGCQHCYAETFAKRTGNAVWGADAPRRFFGQKHWNEPLRWAEKAGASPHKPRVFCASMADVCEDRRDLDAERDRLWTLIQATAPALDWLLLTKRPENLRRLVPEDILRRCWVGTTAEDQPRADQRIPHLLATPAAVRFVSVEPMLGPVDLNAVPRPELIALNPQDGRLIRGVLPRWQTSPCRAKLSNGIDWVICGSESGNGARPMHEDWVRSLRDQCAAAGVKFFYKQRLERGRKVSLPMLDGAQHAEWPR